MGLLTPKLLGIASLVGILATVILRWGIVDPIVNAQLSKRLRLEPGTQIWDIWTDVPIPIYMRFTFFNVTNPEEVVRGAKPVVQEIGPYVYEEKRKKIVLNVNDETVKYRPKTYYYFRHDLSYGTQNDNITMLNVPYVGIARIAWEISKQPFVLEMLDDMLSEKGEQIFHTHSVADLLFDGVSIDNFMALLSMPGADAYTSDFKIPKRLQDGDFGFLDDKNGTADEVWLVKTGKDNNDNFGKTVSWNGMPTLTFWKDNKCNRIDGTDGTIFPPFATKHKILSAFSPDLCRVVKMVYNAPSEVMGIPTLRFGFSPDLFGSVSEYPENECYCQDSWESCKKGGVISLAPCIGGAPVFASRPHFAGAHKDFVDGVTGLTPNGDYSSYADIEPHIGLPIKATLRIQINVELEPYESMPSFASLPRVMFPLLWAEETVSATEELLAPIKLLVLALNILDVVAQISILLGCLGFIFALVWHGMSNKWHVKLSDNE